MQVKKNDMPISEALGKFLKQKKITPGYHNSRIQQVWKEKMGASVNQHTRSIKLYGDELYIKLDSAPLKNEFHLGKEKLMNLLNTELGKSVIKKIHLS